MKINIKTLLASAAILSLFTTCKKEEKSAAEAVQQTKPAEIFTQSVILSKTADLCLLGRDEKMHSVKKLSRGDTLDVIFIEDSADKVGIPIIHPQELPDGEKSGEKVEPEIQKPVHQDFYFHVVYDSVDYWLLETDVAINAENAVTIAKTPLYEDPKLESGKILSPESLGFGTAIAKSTLREDSGENSEKIYFWNSDSKKVEYAYARAENISTVKDDVAVMEIVDALKVTKRAVPRNELFKKAAKYKPSAKVKAALDAQSVETRTYSYSEVLKAMSKQRYGVSVPELLTVDQSKDPFK